MDQVAFKIYRTKFNGDHFAESSGIGFQDNNSLIVPMMTSGDTPKAYLREFVLNNNFREYNGWHYGIVTYVAKTQDGSLVPQEWHVSYRALETDAEKSAKAKKNK